MPHLPALSRSRAVAGSLLLGVGAVALIAARPPDRVATPDARASGITFTYRVTSSSADKKQREMRSNLSTVRMQDGNIRMDYIEGQTPMGQKNGYIIVQGDAGKFVIVDPKEKKAMIMTADAMGSGFGALLNNPLVKLTVSNTSFKFKDLGAGEPILGYKTRKVRTYYTSTVEMKVMMMNQKTTSNDSSDQWIANLDFDQRSMESWAKSFASGVKSTNSELAKDLAAYTKEYGRSGMALKTVSWSTQTDKKGKVTADTMTMEMTDLKTGDLDASIFQVPAGYEVTDLSKMMSDMTAAMDSASAGAAKGEPKAEEKVNAKDAIKAGLGGFMKKKK